MSEIVILAKGIYYLHWRIDEKLCTPCASSFVHRLHQIVGLHFFVLELFLWMSLLTITSQEKRQVFFVHMKLTIIQAHYLNSEKLIGGTELENCFN